MLGSRWMIAALATATTLAITAAGCQPANEYAPPPPPEVTVERPVERPVTEYIEVTGTTQACERVELQARVNGYLQSIEFEDGDDVKEGELLFVIEPEPFEVALAGAEAELKKAETSLKLAEVEVRRIAELLRRQATTPQDVDVEVAKRDTAVADVASAESAVAAAKLQLAYTKVEAPITGRIGRHLVDIGNLIRAEQTTLAAIESIDPIDVYATLSEGQVLKLTRLRQERVIPEYGDAPILLEMALGDEEGFPHEGQLDFAELGVDPETGTTIRRGIFPNPDRTIVPGLYARVRGAIGDAKPKFLVPDRALGSDQRGRFLLIVGEGDKVEYRPVVPGIRMGELRVIEKGVGPEDRVIVNGLLRARPGAVVNPSMAEATPESQSAPGPAQSGGEAAEAEPARAAGEGTPEAEPAASTGDADTPAEPDSADGDGPKAEPPGGAGGDV